MTDVPVIPNAVAAAPTGVKKRRPARPPVVLTPRDLAILRDLFDSRVLTARQLADVHFGGSRNAAKQRLWALGRNGLIAARYAASPFAASFAQPQPLRLTREGFDALRERSALDDYPRITWAAMSVRLKVSPLSLTHELDVGTLKAAVHRAARLRGDANVDLFVTWPRLLRFRVRPPNAIAPVDVSPDGFVRLTYGDGTARAQADCFLENDRSTETLGRIVGRAAAYVAYYATGGYAKRQGVADAEARAFPFRVLWTFVSRSRLDGFADGCRRRRPPILKMMWLATLADAARDPLGPVWRRPIDVRDTRLPLLPPTMKATQAGPR